MKTKSYGYINPHSINENQIKKPALIFLFYFEVILIYGQTENASQKDNSKPFIIGVIVEIQSVQLRENRIFSLPHNVKISNAQYALSRK